jgi:hypothetical protein
MAGGPPPSGPWEGEVTSPYSRSIVSTTVALLLRGTGGLTILVRASTPSFTLEVLVAGVHSAAAAASSVGAWNMGRGGDVVCVRLCL